MNITPASTSTKQKKAYRRPVLVRFGEVRSLTQSGSTGPNEGSGQFPSMVMSDRRLKHNVVRVGDHPLGIGLYLFDFKPEFRTGCEGRQFGVMVDEVEAVMPQAVSVGANGYKVVDYAMLGIRRSQH
jgi:hypothetical protein